MKRKAETHVALSPLDASPAGFDPNMLECAHQRGQRDRQRHLCNNHRKFFNA
jgi:hypothetical protein